MPSQENHLSTALENRAVSFSLLDSKLQSLAWATTVSFYSALHLVEAALAKDGIHFENHLSRNNHLKRTNNLQNIWKHYKPLYDFSLKARYLMLNGGSAETFMREHLGENGVKDRILNHHLKQIEKSVSKILRVGSIFPNSQA